MKKYRNKYKKERNERIGFVTALTVCVIAIGLAIGSTYASIGGLEGNLSGGGGSGYTGVAGGSTQSVDSEVKGLVVEKREAETTSAPVTEAATTEAQGFTEEVPTELSEPDVPKTSGDKLQTIFQVTSSLLYPVENPVVSKEYSEQAVYNETMQDYRPHTGVDFLAEEGEAVLSVCDGIVDDITEDDLYGTILKVTNGTYSVYYCGVYDVMVHEGQSVDKEQILACVGEIPCECEDEFHIHMEVRVNGNPIDPLTVISNDE